MSANFRNVALGVILLAVTVTAATSCKKRTFEVPKQETEPWPIAAIWAWHDYVAYQDNSAPSLVVYSNGRIILKKISPIDRTARPFSIPTVTFWTKLLTAEELADFQERISTVVKDPKIDAYSAISENTDQSETEFYFGTKGKGFVVNVYGLWLEQPDDASFLKYPKGMDKLPDSLFRYCAYLPSIVMGEFEPWKPEHLVLEFRSSLGDRAKRLHWPDTWPSPDSPSATLCKERKFVVLEIKEQAGLQQLLGTERRDEYMEIEAGGKNYRAAYHYHFPGEEAWYRESGVIDFDSFVQPIANFRAPVVPRPVPPKNAFELK